MVVVVVVCVCEGEREWQRSVGSVGSEGCTRTQVHGDVHVLAL